MQEASRHHHALDADAIHACIKELMHGMWCAMSYDMFDEDAYSSDLSCQNCLLMIHKAGHCLRGLTLGPRYHSLVGNTEVM